MGTHEKLPTQTSNLSAYIFTLLINDVFIGGMGASDHPIFVKLQESTSKSHPCCKRDDHSAFLFPFFLVTIVGQMVKMPPKRKVSRHISSLGH